MLARVRNTMSEPKVLDGIAPPPAGRYELSQSSFYVAEAAHLIELAAAVGRPEATAHLVAREKAMRSLVASEMWDDSRQIFANKYPVGGKNSGFGAKISPTSFYPLMARPAPRTRLGLCGAHS